MTNRAIRFALPLLAASLAASPTGAVGMSASMDRSAPAPRLAIAAPAVGTKASAILGTSSALAAIRSQQAAPALPIASMTGAVTATPTVATPVAATSIVATTAASSLPSTEGLRPAHRLAPDLRPAHAVRPDVFGSTALSVSKTAFNDRFAQVFASRALGPAAAVAARHAATDRMSALHDINAYVNARVTFTDDQRAHGRADRWNAAAETLSSGRGDCEDYAIAKMQMLRAAGFDAEDLYLVVLKDLVRRADHAVLVVRHDDRFLVLDNGTDRILDSDDVRDYKPIFSYSAGKSWIHGYERKAPVPAPPRSLPVQVAALAAN
ncbi:transglutaminase-like cysteine peptidase [Sphingomicrobium arenosum]|uniref:transglutaminase-like cysteine peptidase n=1 Tax=Sphingomicrobium arenosum TaxID=2233861 RepID=UPI002240F605|nr:transglutaminase-like cysteine peptidase [Sphingomicrobium arenosum]